MEPGDDKELHNLLKEWHVPDAPRSLDERVLRRQQAWWRVLLTGSIRIPVPVALAVTILFIMMATILVRQPDVPQPAASSVSLEDFRPVKDLNVRVIRHDAN
jgi:hypothetical protein